MFNPFRSLAERPQEPPPEKPLQVTRTASWSLGKVHLHWVRGSCYVELRIEDGVDEVEARLHVRDVLQFREALSIAFEEANKLDFDSGSTSREGT